MDKAGDMLYIGIDVGGTFTDVLVFDDQTKNFSVNKVLTTTKRIEEGIVDALRNYRKRSNEVSLISHATTVATNALLTHTGLAHTALITNEGFRDVLEIGRQRRAELYDLENKRPVPLVKRRDRFTLRGRILSDGSENQPLSKSQLRKLTRLILRGGYECVVVAFLNSYVNQKHEKEVSHFIKNEGFRGHIDISSEISREYREYERFSSAVVNACLSPLVSSYLANLTSALKKEKFKAPIYVMNSDGSASTIRNAAKYPVLMIESGPAAGVLASRYISRLVSLPNILTFDMGGTTAKAGAVVNYEPDVAYEFEAAGQTHSGRSIKGSGYPVRAPFIDLAEVSAGGGTIAWVDDAGALKVGPKSAGSDPGPAVYGKGGEEPTVTDANVVLGRINPDFLLGGAMRLNRKLGYDSLRTKVAKRLGMNVEEAAQGIIRIVNITMARAISIVSVERGRDPRDFSLIAFGGAGPIHACDLAEELEISRIVLPEHAGLFSAYGLLTADLERNFVLPVMKDLSNAELEVYFSKLNHIAHKTLGEEDPALSRFKTIESVDARYHGQSYQIPIRYSRKGGSEAIARRFNTRHKELYGYSSNDTIEIVTAKLRAVIPSAKLKPTMKGRNYLQNTMRDSTRLSHLSEIKTRRAWLSGKYYDVRAFSRDLLGAGSQGKGPCIIEEYDSTAVINPSWSWKIDRHRNIILTRKTERKYPRLNTW